MTTEQQSAIDAGEDLADLLEAAGGLKGLRHGRHSKVLKPLRATVEKILRGYFARQEAALLVEIRPKIRPLLAMREAQRSVAGQRFADTLLPTSLHPLRFPVTGTEANAFGDAIEAAVAGAAAVMVKQMRLGVTLAPDAAGNYLRDNSLTKLTGELFGKTVGDLRAAVADAWDAGGSAQQIEKAITDTFSTFSETRAKRIAQTEVNDAYNAGRRAIANAAGFDQKAWDPDGEACPEICQPNADQGWIPIDDDFQSGDSEPTAHPNCDCGIDFRSSVAA